MQTNRQTKQTKKTHLQDTAKMEVTFRINRPSDRVRKKSKIMRQLSGILCKKYIDYAENTLDYVEN